jgi:hypothetical protein
VEFLKSPSSKIYQKAPVKVNKNQITLYKSCLWHKKNKKTNNITHKDAANIIKQGKRISKKTYLSLKDWYLKKIMLLLPEYYPVYTPRVLCQREETYSFLSKLKFSESHHTL